MADDQGKSEDSFITQNTFNKNKSVSTQEANNAAGFFLNMSDEFNNSGEVIEYFDFGKEETGAKDVKPASPLVQLDADNLFPVDDDEVSDEQLSQVLDSVEKELGLNRFGNLVSDEFVAENSTKKFAPATEKKADWAYKTYGDWVQARNYHAEKNGSLVRVSSSLTSLDCDEICFNVCRFILEVRKQNGDDYPSDTLYELVLALQHYMKSHGRDVKFLEDPSFEEIKNTLDNRMKFLCAEGKFAKRQKADIITDELEEILWQRGFLGEDNPKQLSDTLVYFFGIHFALRAGQEHKNLRVGPNSQLRLKYDDKVKLWYLEYCEDVSKTNQGGLDHRKVQRKIVRAYQNEVNPDRCIVHYYKKYLAVRPKDNCPEDFCLRPLQEKQDGVWFYAQAIGCYKLSCVVSDMCKGAGFQGKFTNHSLRASCASRLYHQHVDEQLICEKTGHRSDAVRSYKRTSDGQLKEMSDILYGNTPKVVPCEVSQKKPKVESCSTEVLRSPAKKDHDDDSGRGSFPVYVNVNVQLSK